MKIPGIFRKAAWIVLAAALILINARESAQENQPDVKPGTEYMQTAGH